MPYEYDDPYSFLAWYIISISTKMEIVRTLKDSDYLYRMLLKEVRNQDLRGPFVDCIVDDILRNKERMQLMHELDKLSEFLFTKLDLVRLRAKIIQLCRDYDILDL